LLLRNENNERIPSIATPLIEMGFSARLVQRAILALGIKFKFYNVYLDNN
jgi:hypothetical protein